MNQISRVAAAAALAASSPSVAQPAAEALAASARARFEAAVAAAPANSGADVAAGARVSSGRLGDADYDISVPVVVRRARPALTPAADLDLAPMLNANVKTSLRFRLGDRSVWFGGAFDISQTPYVSVLAEGAAPLYFNVLDLVSSSRRVPVGGASYTLSLSPNIFQKMRSVLRLTNDARPGEQASFTVQQMLDAVTGVGRSVALGGQAYVAYYTDGLDKGKADSAARLLVFITVAGGNYHVYLVRESAVSAGQVAVVEMLGGRRVGLSRQGGRLLVYDNP